MERRRAEAGGRRRKSRDALTSGPEIERLLEVARAPASPRELAGEHAAVDLFARASLERAASESLPPAGSSGTGLKAAAASLAAVVAMSSGVAFAATGHVPFVEKLKQVTRQVTGQSADDPTASSQARRHEGDSTTPNGPKAAALPGLCHAFARGQKATHGHGLEARPFTALVEAAGGAERVADFCAALPPSRHGKATHPGHPAHPSDAPSHGPRDGPSTSDPGETHPTKPAHPTKPTQASEPTHKPKPSHDPKPTHQPKPTHAPRPTDKPSHTGKPHPSH
jgi:hypothetical protein